MKSCAVLLALVSVAAAASVAVAPAVGFAQEKEAPPATLDEQYYRAFYAENGLRDFAKAAADYELAWGAASVAGNKDLQVKCLLGRGRCLRVMDRQDEARRAFAKALALDPENAEAKRGAAAEAAADIDAALRDTFSNLVETLGGEQREQAKSDLLRIGARALPVLEEEGLRSTNVGIVAASSEVLARMDAPGARAALARAFNDSTVTYPRVLIAAVGMLPRANQDADPEGRIALLREILQLKDTDFLTKALRMLVNGGFAASQATRVAGAVNDFLAVADDAWKRHVLGLSWGSAVSRELMATSRALLASGNAELRGTALEQFHFAPKEMVPEDAAAVRGFLEKGTPDEKLTALKILDSRGLLSDEERGAVISGLLAGDEAAARGALDWVWTEPNAGRPVRWSSDCVPGFLSGFRTAIDGGHNEETLGLFARTLHHIGSSLSDDDLLDLIVRSSVRHQTGGIQQVEVNASAAAARRWENSRDPEGISTAFLRGFGRLQGKGREYWFGHWARMGKELSPAAVMTVAEDTSDDPTARVWAYRWMLDRGARNFPVPTPALLDNIGKDLFSAHGGGVANVAHEILEELACPALADPVRRLIRQGKSRSTGASLLGLLVKCDGKAAIPDLREVLVREPSSDRAASVSGLSMSAATLLVETAGKDALPDLLALAGKIDPLMVVGFPDSAWAGRLPRDMLEAFLDRLPVQRRTGDLVATVLDRVSESRRTTLVGESLGSADPQILAAAAAAIRKFNMLLFWPRLIPLLDSADSRVRSEAQESLDAIRKYRELKASFERFGEDGASKALDDAIAYSKSPQPERRRAAALALGALGERSAVSVLLLLSGDPDASVREAALAALERMGGAVKPEGKGPGEKPAGDGGK